MTIYDFLHFYWQLYWEFVPFIKLLRVVYPLGIIGRQEENDSNLGNRRFIIPITIESRLMKKSVGIQLVRRILTWKCLKSETPFIRRACLLKDWAGKSKRVFWQEKMREREREKERKRERERGKRVRVRVRELYLFVRMWMNELVFKLTKLQL